MRMLMKLAAIVAAGLLLCAPAYGADVKISAMPAASLPDANIKLSGVQGSGCATATSPCSNVTVTTGNLASYLAGTSAFTSAFQGLDADLTSLAGASSTDALYYRASAGNWSPVTVGSGLSFSSGTLAATATGALIASNNLSDLANAGTARTNLGLGTIATQSAASVAITGGSISGITDLAVADGGTGASTASAARTNLGLGTIATAGATDYRLSPPIMSGQFTPPDGYGSITTAGVAPGADTLKMFLGYVRKDITINGISLRVSTVSAGGNCKAAIYAMDASSGWPTGAPLVTSAALSTATAVGVSDTSVSYSITTGWYWFATLCDNGTVALYSVSMTGAQGGLIGASNATNVGGINGLTKSSVTYSGGFPTLTGNKSTDGLSDNATASVPIVAIKR